MGAIREGQAAARASAGAAPSISPLALLLVVGSLMTVSALATDVMLPAFPTMARAFGVSDATIQQVVSVFMLGYALPQFLIGSLADRFGRRPVLVGGLLVYLAGSPACLAAPSLGWLLAGRFVQGLGSAAGPILSRAVLRDLYAGAELGRMLSYAMIVFSAAPLLAPAIGALMLRLGNWELIFVFLLLVAVALLALVLLALPETLARPDPDALRLGGVWRNAVRVAGDPRSAWSLLFMTFTYAGLMAYLLSASALYIGWFGLDESGFALVFAVVAATSFVTQPVNARLLRRYEPVQVVGVALPAFLVVGALMLVQALLGALTLVTFVVSVSAFFACFSFIMGNGTTMALDPHEERAGIASGLLGFAQLALGTALGALIGGFAEHGPVALATGLTLLALLAYPCYRLAARRGDAPSDRLT